MLYAFLLNVAAIVLGVLLPIVLLVMYAVVERKIKHAKPIEEVIEELQIKHSAHSTLNWINRLISKLVPLLTSQTMLQAQINKALAEVPKSNTKIQKISLIDFQISQTPPALDSARLISTPEGQGVELKLHYSPELIVNTDIQLKIPVIGTVSGGAKLQIRDLSGGIRLIVPEHSGEARIELLDSTDIRIDAGARLGPILNITTDFLGSVWQQLESWAITYLRNLVIKIPLEENLKVPVKLEKSPAKAKPKSEAKTKSDSMINVKVSFDTSTQPFEF